MVFLISLFHLFHDHALDLLFNAWSWNKWKTKSISFVGMSLRKIFFLWEKLDSFHSVPFIEFILMRWRSHRSLCDLIRINTSMNGTECNEVNNKNVSWCRLLLPLHQDIHFYYSLNLFFYSYDHCYITMIVRIKE